MMVYAHIVYDNLRYFMTYDNENDILTEGYDGFKIQEVKGKYFVIYKEINRRGEEVKKRYVLPDNDLETFFALEKKYKDFFTKQQCLDKMVQMVSEAVEVEESCNKSLKRICDETYSLPENYIKFVAMNITKNQFYRFVKNRLSLKH